MNYERVTQWTSLAANVGVFLGFLMLAYQIHQQSAALASTSNQQSYQLFASGEEALMGDTGFAAYAKAMDSPESLSPEELVQVWTYLTVATYTALQVFEDYRQGVVSKETWLYAREIFVGYINHPVGLIVWEAYAKFPHAEAQRFIAAIQERLDEVPRNAAQQQFRYFLGEVAKIQKGGPTG